MVAQITIGIGATNKKERTVWAHEKPPSPSEDRLLAASSQHKMVLPTLFDNFQVLYGNVEFGVVIAV